MIDELKLIDDCLEIMTPPTQVDKAMEELFELGAEIAKLKTGAGNMQKIASEMADVMFVSINQMKRLLDVKSGGQFSKLLEIEYDYKLERTSAMIENKKLEVANSTRAQPPQTEKESETCPR
jgi:hypothetical protein